MKISNPYLHELFKSVLIYDAHDVKKLLAGKIGGKLLKKWELVRAYQEISPTREKERYKGKIDVLWVLKHPEREELGFRRILHEVKTGVYDVNDVVKKYKGLRYFEIEGDAGSFWSSAGTTNTPIYIWSWKELHQDYPNNGSVKQMPLEWLLIILRHRLKDLIKLLE